MHPNSHQNNSQANIWMPFKAKYVILEKMLRKHPWYNIQMSTHIPTRIIPPKQSINILKGSWFCFNVPNPPNNNSNNNNNNNNKNKKDKKDNKNTMTPSSPLVFSNFKAILQWPRCCFAPHPLRNNHWFYRVFEIVSWRPAPLRQQLVASALRPAITNSLLPILCIWWW